MNSESEGNSETKGNSPERWEKLLSYVDSKLQLGLLEHLRRVSSYHFEGEMLFIESGSTLDQEYLSKDAVLQQLKLLAADSIQVHKIEVQAPEE